MGLILWIVLFSLFLLLDHWLAVPEPKRRRPRPGERRNPTRRAASLRG
ncbi:MAG: hypothetical protein ACOX8R_05960 [Bacillota bacterium]